MMKQDKITVYHRMLTLICGLALTATAFAQQVVVKGHVKDATGEPIIGATVRVAGQDGGTVTDIDGNFTMEVPAGATVSVSYIGFEEAKATASGNLVITMQEANKSLNEVVVIGYGRAKKSDLTGSVTAIKPDELNHGLQTNAQDMIQGKIAGVSVISDGGTPGGGSTIRIRGGSSLNASNDPLIVIDGLAMDTYGVQGLANPLSMVNPNDIESFTVLKDASATAIYGSRASNGVIIITTKKGRKGAKPSVSYNGNLSIASNKKTLDVMNAAQYMEFIKNLYGEDSEAYDKLGYLDADGNKQYADTDWQDEIMRTGVSTDHNVTVSGGLGNMPYRVSMGYTQNNGIVKTSKFERYTASVNLSPSFFKNEETGEDRLKINFNAKGMLAKNRYAEGGVIGAAIYMDPTKPVRADNDIYNKFFGGYGQWYSAAEYADPEWKYTNNRNATQNPVATLNNQNNRAISRTLLGNIEVDYAIHGFEDLHLHANAGLDLSNGSQTNDISKYSASNNYYGWWGKNWKDTYNMQLSIYAQYMKDFAEIHHIDVMAGHEFQKFHQKTDWYGYGLYPSTNTEHAGERFNAPAADQVTKYKSENALESWFGRMNYTLLDRYMFTFTMRADGSSRFNWLKTADNQQWGYFPSAAFAWRINEEPFLRDVKAISDFKLRLGWGITGQQEGIGDYTYIPTYTPNQNSHALYPILGDGKTYRPDAYNNQLTWEKTTTYNAGVDLSLLNDRLVFNLDWYYRKTKDLINDVYVSAGSNFSNIVKSNIGSLHNTGFEFATTVRPIVNKDWRWELTYNFTYNKNKIDELITGEGDDYYVETGGISGGTGLTIQGHHVGNATSAFYVYQQVYDGNGNPIPNTYVDRNGNGITDTGDRYFYYKPAPDVTMGLGSKLQYKNWDFSFSARASLGNYVYNNVLSGMQNVGAGAIYTLGYLQNRSTDAVKQGFTNPLTNQLLSDYYVQNASFLKLDNITLGYSFGNLLGAKISGRVYATVQNVFTITNYDGLDPEVSSGIDNNFYPRPFQTILGLNLNF
jgi:TonB-linked SusC/RagA family outer membrane protein